MIDDGSSDRTVEVARECGVHHVVSHDVNRGLARAFMTGIEASLRAGADVIVNTDADNQYFGADIAKLVDPGAGGDADVVVGTRPLSSISTFSPVKKALQHLGTHAVRVLSGTEVRDATSGFRAFSREAALRLQVHGKYTYTLETIIQVGAEGLKLKAVPIRVNPQIAAVPARQELVRLRAQVDPDDHPQLRPLPAAALLRLAVGDPRRRRHRPRRALVRPALRRRRRQPGAEPGRRRRLPADGGPVARPRVPRRHPGGAAQDDVGHPRDAAPPRVRPRCRGGQRESPVATIATTAAASTRRRDAVLGRGLGRQRRATSSSPTTATTVAWAVSSHVTKVRWRCVQIVLGRHLPGECMQLRIWRRSWLEPLDGDIEIALGRHIAPADRRQQAHHRRCPFFAHVLLEPGEQMVAFVLGDRHR